MDEAQMAEILENKRQNPRLKRTPLDLGTKFINFSDSKNEITIENPLEAYPVLLLLFGAEWCNITRPFVNELKKHYNQINLQKKNIQIIYVSLDKARKNFDSFTQKFPWLGIAPEDPRIKGLKEFYNIRSIPSLILTDVKGENLGNARDDIYKLGEDEAFEKWKAVRHNLEQVMKEQ